MTFWRFLLTIGGAANEGECSLITLEAKQYGSRSDRITRLSSRTMLNGRADKCFTNNFMVIEIMAAPMLIMCSY